MADAYKPEYPVILTKANWDKKKGVIAKVASKTGIGEQMLKLKAAYDNADWFTADVAYETEHNSGQLFSEAWLQDAIKKANALYASGSIRKMVEEAYALRDIANEAQKNFAKSKVIPSSDTKHVALIATTADHFGVANNANSFKSRLEDQVKRARAWHLEKIKRTAGPALNILKKALERTPNYIKLMKANLTPDGVNEPLKSASRDLTQNMLNIKKGVAVGIDYGIDTKRLIEIGEELVKWGNVEATIFKPDTDVKVVTKAVNDFEKLAHEAWNIVK